MRVSPSVRVWSDRTIGRRVGDAVFREAAATQQARVAVAAGQTVGGRIVAGERHRVVHAELQTAPDDLGLGHSDERGVDAHPLPPLHGRLGGQIGHALVRSDVFRTTIRVTGRIYGGDAD